LKEQINILWELQKVDTEMLDVDRKLKEISPKKEKLERRLKELEDEKSLKEESLNRTTQEKERKEKEIEQEENKIKMVESRISHIRNQKDYQEVRKKLDLARKSNKLREEEVINKMEESEKLTEELNIHIPVFEEERTKIESSVMIYENEKADLEKSKEEISERREVFLKKLDVGILKKYDVLRKSLRGVGISRAKNEACEGCFMNLPPQLYNMVIKGDKIYHCPFCQRFIIHIPESGD
jgi:predicted  nucleic acid-binding Zn-ribbon protein